jgi:multidrug efflux pump subunit AcrB
MISSYVLSSTIVPVLATWIMRHKAAQEKEPWWRRAYGWYATRVVNWRWIAVALYVIICGVALWITLPKLQTEIFPTVDAGQFQVRLRAPVGTRIERTELVALRALDAIKQEVGADNVAISTAFIGVQPASYPINTIYLWTSGPHEAVMLVAIKPSAMLRGEALKERLRARLHEALPNTEVSFEAGDIVTQVMSFGSPTPIEVAVQGPSLAVSREHATKIRAQLEKISEFRDLQYGQPLDYPTIDVKVDRERAGQFGLTTQGVVRSLVAATSSSRFIEPNYWRDPGSGNGFQIQVEIPQSQMKSMEDAAEIPVMNSGTGRPLLGDVATLKYGTAPGAVERYNMQRVVSITANIHGKPLGAVASDLTAAIRRAGDPPRGTTVSVRGQIPSLDQTISGLSTGLLLSVAVIALLLAANFQSVRLALAVVSTVPAVLVGVTLMLLATGTTLNVQSFMGAIMAIGIAVANSILLVTFAELRRKEGGTTREAAVDGAKSRLRAILMTASAMIAGMLPVALGLGEGAEQTAPLGRAVIGGLAMATIATLTVLPAVYAVLQRSKAPRSVSLDPDDPESRYFQA